MDANQRGNIWVVGCPRSGTTLVQSVLAAHSSVMTFKESHFLDWGFRLYPLLGNLAPSNASTCFRRFVLANQLGDGADCDRWTAEMGALPTAEAKLGWFVRFLYTQASKNGKQLWVEKTPGHVFYIDLIERVAPGSLFVHVVRPPADTIASLHEAVKKWNKWYPWWFLYLYWKRSVSQSLKCVGNPNHHFVFFDDLLNEPDAVTAGLIDFTGLPMETDLLRKRQDISSSLVSEEEKAWKNNVSRAIGDAEPHGEVRIPRLIRFLLDRDRSYARLYDMVKRGASAASN